MGLDEKILKTVTRMRDKEIEHLKWLQDINADPKYIEESENFISHYSRRLSEYKDYFNRMVFIVPVMEYDEGWNNIDDHVVCMSEEIAKNFIKEFNAENNKDKTPKWYMKAMNDIETKQLNNNQYEYLIKTKNGRCWLKQIRDM